MDFYYTQLTIPYWLTNEIIPTDEWDRQDQSISELVVQYIDQGYYIRKMVDEYYLPVREAFGKYHFNHTLQIFGYNLKDRIFHVSGFDESHLYGFQTITFDDFEKSIQNSNAPFSKIKIDKRAHYAFDIQLF